MEIDVTHMVEERDSMVELSGSRMEHGQDAGRITWNNSIKYGREHPLLADADAREAARSHFRDYGAWSREEIEVWSEDELQGITCQLVAGDIREMEAFDSIEEYEKAAEVGTVSGNLYRASDGKWWFYLGS